MSRPRKAVQALLCSLFQTFSGLMPKMISWFLVTVQCLLLWGCRGSYACLWESIQASPFSRQSLRTERPCLESTQLFTPLSLALAPHFAVRRLSAPHHKHPATPAQPRLPSHSIETHHHELFPGRKRTCFPLWGAWDFSEVMPPRLNPSFLFRPCCKL